MGCPVCGDCGALWNAEVYLNGECPCGYVPKKASSNVPADLKELSISQIAMLVLGDWKNVNYAAVPYLNAMRQLNVVNDLYGVENGRSIVLYFLSNASAWRGPVAKAVKAELKARVR